MSVPSPLDIILLLLWPVSLFFAVWGIIIGWRTDQLAKCVGKIYGILGIALQTPMFAAWLGLWGDGYHEQNAATWLIGFIPTGFAIVALVLGLRRAGDADATDMTDRSL